MQILIQKTTIDAEKSAGFKIRQYNDAIKIMQKYPHDILTDAKDVEAHFKANGKKNPASMIQKVKEFIELGYVVLAKEALENPQIYMRTSLQN